MMLYYYYHYHIYYGLQEAKQLLEQGQQQRLDVKETLLETIAVLGQRTHSPSAQLLALAVLVGRLDDLDPGIRSFAAQLLLGECAVYTSDLSLPSCYWVSVLCTPQIFRCPAVLG